MRTIVFQPVAVFLMRPTAPDGVFVRSFWLRSSRINLLSRIKLNKRVSLQRRSNPLSIAHWTNCIASGSTPRQSRQAKILRLAALF
jgi:hypothetical protein